MSSEYQRILSTMRFKRGTNIPIPTLDSIPPTSNRYFDLTSQSPNQTNQTHQDIINPSFTNSPNVVWVNDVGLIQPRKTTSSTHPNLDILQSDTVRPIDQPIKECLNQPLSKSIPIRPNSSSTSLNRHSSSRSASKANKIVYLSPPKLTIPNSPASPLVPQKPSRKQSNPKENTARPIRSRQKCLDQPLSKSIPSHSNSSLTSINRHSSRAKEIIDLSPPKFTISNSSSFLPQKPPRKKRPIQVSPSTSPPPMKRSPLNKKNYASNDQRDSARTDSCILSDVHLSTRPPCPASGSNYIIGGGSSSTSLDILKDMQDTLSMRGISLQTRSFKYRVNYPDDSNDLEDLIQPEDLSLGNMQMIDDPESLCPFCDEPLPNKASSKLLNLLEYLKSKPEVTRRPESMNPLALRLPFSDTASCCELHRAETKVIPDGIRKGWPTTIEFQAIPKRIRSYRKRLHRVCTREVNSYFMQVALKEWTTQGPRKAQSVAHELANFQVEQPGYYGVRGYEVIYRTLQHMFLKPTRIDSITKLAKPLSADFLLRKVLVPETALCLIADDLGLEVNHPKVRETLENSRSFGTFMFPDQDDRINSSGEKSDLDEEDCHDQQPVRSPATKHIKRQALRKSASCEIEILKAGRLSPRKNSTKTAEKKVFSSSKIDRQQHSDATTFKQTSTSGRGKPSTSSKLPSPNKASTRPKKVYKKRRAPSLSD